MLLMMGKIDKDNIVIYICGEIKFLRFSVRNVTSNIFQAMQNQGVSHQYSADKGLTL